MDMNTSANHLRQYAAQWRNYLSRTSYATQTLPNSKLPTTAAEHGSAVLSNLELAISQTKIFNKKKNPKLQNDFYILNRNSNPELKKDLSGLAYSLADNSGKLADILERTSPDKITTATNTSGNNVALSDIISELLQDCESRLEEIQQGYELFDEDNQESSS